MDQQQNGQRQKGPQQNGPRQSGRAITVPRPGKAVRFSIGSQVSSTISEAITASNIKNINSKLEIIS